MSGYPKKATYKKLTRDKVPDRIIADGAEPITRILSDDEFKSELIKKLYEEIKEFEKDRNVSELADICEVIAALAETIGSDFDAVMREKIKKQISHGAFTKRIFLERTI